MRGIYRTFIVIALCAALPACEPEPVRTRFELPPDVSVGQGAADLTLAIAADAPGGAGTKASLLSEVESKGSGALVLVYRTDTRQLDSYRFFTQEEIRAQADVPLKLRVPLARCDFYILGNLNAVRKSDGRTGHLMEALGADFPVDETALEAWVYRLDGGDLNAGWRRQRFAEVAACGIPYMHVRKGVDTAEQIRRGEGIPGSDKCRRLFSKVTVRIDHSAFDGGGAHPELFVNSRLYLRQANARLQPFSEAPQQAAQAADVLPESDYDPQMANGSVMTFSFYVPENAQGELLPGNADSRRKTLDELVSKGLSARAPYLTYVEFSGRLDPSAGGYGGDVTYRFYTGADNCTNFDLIRNREYEISLTFRVGSLFDPDWKVQPENWSDGRLFALTADPAFTTDIGTVRPDRRVAVRGNREGAFYVYMNPAGALGRSKSLLGKPALTNPAYTPASVADCAWYGDFLRPGTADNNWLTARGITPGWDPATGRLKFSVTDAAKYKARIGDARQFTLTLLPGGGSATFSLVLMQDISLTVADGLSLTDGFYLGQKRTVTLSGFAGRNIRYAADQDACGASAGAAHTQNRQWKTTNAASGAFPSCAVDGSGRVLLDVSNAAYASQACTGSLDLYAFYPNRFLATHSGWTSKSGRIIFFSEDYLNDSFEAEIRISEPRLNTGTAEQHLPIDGNEVQTDIGYWTFDGTARLPASSFDATLLQTRLGLGLRSVSGAPYSAWASCLALDPGTGLMYVKATTSSAGNLEERTYSRTNGSYNTSLARWQVYPRVLTDLYGNSPAFDVRVTKLLVRNLRSGIWTMKEGNDVAVSGVSMLSSYYATNTIGGEEQLTEQTRFSVSAEYYFVHGDLSRIEWSRSGDATSYTCTQAPYETFHPVIDFTVDTDDTGEGGTFSWVYDESHQVMRSSTGEPVPGGLIVPFGRQYMTGTYRNKWDGRTFQVKADFNLTYPVLNGSLLVVARPGNARASVYLMPQKIIKYLKSHGPSVNTTARHQMMQLFNRSDWMNSVQFTNCYQTRPGLNAYHSPGMITGSPRNDYDIKYLWGFVYDRTDVTEWSQTALSLLLSPSSQRPTASGVAQSAMVQNYNSDIFTTLANTASYVQGIWWMKSEAF